MRAAALLPLALVLAGCGAAQGLEPAPGKTLPVAPRGAVAVPTATQLLTPTPQQRPERSDDLLTNSDERRTDTFDLPPQR